MASNGTEARVPQLPLCDICRHHYKGSPASAFARAAYDGKTSLGLWAYMCEDHYAEYGVGLGIGRGQRLVVEGGA